MIKGLVYQIVPGTMDYNRDIAWICRELMESEWGARLTPDKIKSAMLHSFNFGIYEMMEGNPIIVGFARVVSDHWLFSSICDFIITEKKRRQGLGTQLIQDILSRKYIGGTECILHTTQARDFYGKFGFRPHMTGVMLRPSRE
jgi:GNAT superfamily N-acetyltransferase